MIDLQLVTLTSENKIIPNFNPVKISNKNKLNSDIADTEIQRIVKILLTTINSYSFNNTTIKYGSSLLDCLKHDFNNKAYTPVDLETTRNLIILAIEHVNNLLYTQYEGSYKYNVTIDSMDYDNIGLGWDIKLLIHAPNGKTVQLSI